MNDRVVKPILKIKSPPPQFVKFLQTCQSLQSLTKNFYDISLECELENFKYNLPNLKLYVCVSLVVSDEKDINNSNPLYHPYQLKCSNSEVRIRSEILIQGLSSKTTNNYLFEINKETMRCNINDLYILCLPNDKLMEYFEILSVKQTAEAEQESIIESPQEDINAKIDHVKNLIRFNSKQLALDLNKCKLKLQVLIHDLSTNKLENYLTEPIFTKTILNQVSSKLAWAPCKSENLVTDLSILNLNNLRILRSSRLNGSVNGGEEMIILTSFFNPDDIEVEFFQFKNDTEIGWRCLAQFNKTDIHGNCSLVIKTPKYTSDKPSQSFARIKVYYRLFRPSTKEYSEKWPFYYCQDNQDFKSLFGDCFTDNKLLKKKDMFLGKMVDISTSLKRKSTEKSASVNNEKKDSSENSKKIRTDPSASPNKPNEYESLLENESDYLDYDEEEDIQTVDKTLNTVFSGDADEGEKTNDKSVLCVKEKNSNDKSTNVNFILDEMFDNGKKKTQNLSEVQLKNNLDNCISKMNALADRTGKALLKFAKTRSFHELLKTQRFLINCQDDDGNTPIHLSIIYGNFDLLELFVDVAMTIPYQNLINIKNHKQLTPLLVACHLGEIEVCEFLLEANADLTQTDLYGCNPIHIACKSKNINLLRVLIKYVDKNCHYGILNSINHEGYAPIHLAVMSESVDIVHELLFNKNLKINIPDKRAGFTALHYAASSPSLLNICSLLVKNESIDINSKSNNGSTPLHMAVANKNYLITCLLLSYGANLNIQSDSPVHFDLDLFQMCLRKNSILRRCVEEVNEKLNLAKSKSIFSAKQIISSGKTEVGNTNGEKKTEKSEQLGDLTKFSEEVKKLYDEYDKSYGDDEPKIKVAFHNYDAFYYAQNDPWVFE